MTGDLWAFERDTTVARLNVSCSSNDCDFVENCLTLYAGDAYDDMGTVALGERVHSSGHAVDTLWSAVPASVRCADLSEKRRRAVREAP